MKSPTSSFAALSHHTLEEGAKRRCRSAWPARLGLLLMMVVCALAQRSEAQTFTFSTTTPVLGPSAGTSTIIVKAPTQTTSWFASSTVGWIHLSAANTTGTGNVTLEYTYDTNTGATRTGYIFMQGDPILVTQTGAGYQKANASAAVPKIGASFSAPEGLASDSSGNIYICDHTNFVIQKWMPALHETEYVVVGLTGPQGVAVDAAGNLYITDSDNQVKEWSASTTLLSVLINTGKGLKNPNGICVGINGNIYIADTGNNAIKMYNPTTKALTTVVSGLKAPMGLTTDVQGNLYYTNSGDGTFGIISGKSGSNTNFKMLFSPVATTITTPTAIAVDQYQNMYITDSGANRLWKVDFVQLSNAVGGLLTDNGGNTNWTLTDIALSTLRNNLNAPIGVAVDPNNTIYYSDTGNNLFNELPFAFFNPAAVSIPNATASYALPTVYPTSADITLGSSFYPTSSQLWLSISSSFLGAVHYFVSADVGPARTAAITLFGTQINVTEAVGTAAPKFTSVATTTFTEGVLGSYTVATSGYPISTYSLTGTLPSNVTFDVVDGIFDGTPAAGTHGSYPVTITATNGINPNATQSFTLVVATPPVFSSANSTTFVTGSLGNFQATATGFPAPTFTQTGTLPKGVTFVAGKLSGTPAANTGGDYPLTITAANGGTPSAVQSFDLVVDQPVVITSANNTTFTVGKASTFPITATGYPTPTITQTGGTLPSGVSFSNGVLSGTPATGIGASYPLQFTVTNGAGSTVVQNFTLTVSQAPAITSPNSLALTVGVPVNTTLTATGFPAPTITQAGLIPTGLTFTNGLIKGTPGIASVGTYTWLITAANKVGANATQIFTVTVTGAPTTTTVTQALPPVHAVAGQSVSIYATVTSTYTAFPTGTVTFVMDGTTKLAPVAYLTNVGGKATAIYTSTLIPPGQHEFTATYSGSTTYAASSAGSALSYLIEPKLNTLHTFAAQAAPLATNGVNADGAAPASQLVQGANGLLYGTTQLGGLGNSGSVFSITTAGVFTNLHSFARLSSSANADGANPYGGLIYGAGGVLYGTAPHGGTHTQGTAFKLTPNINSTLWTFGSPALYNFGSAANDGTAPYGKLVLGHDGNFYGVTSAGGANGTGSIFQLTPGGVISTLYSFTALTGGNNNDGATPISELTLGTDGYFYGVTSAGGANGSGAVFAVSTNGTSAGTTLTPLYSFTALSSGTNVDGSAPSGALAQGLDGNFYGVCGQGGTNGNGSIYVVTPVAQGGVFTSLYSFSAFSGKTSVLPSGINIDGANPSGTLVQNSGGVFYGVTKGGGYGGTGIIYSLETDGTVNGTAQNMIYNFSPYTYLVYTNGGNTDGAAPLGGPILAADGKLYGTTSAGGTYGVGTVYQIQPPPTWHALATTINNLAPGAREGVANSVANQYFYSGTDGNLWGATSNGANVWTATKLTNLTPAQQISDWLVWDPVYTQVYWQGKDGNIWCYLYSHGGSILNLTTTTPNVAGDLTLHPLNSSASLQLINYRTTDNRIWAVSGNLSSGALFQEALITGKADTPNVAGNLSADDVNHYVYYRALDNSMWAYYLVGTQWYQTQLTKNTNVASGVTADTNLTVYYRATDNSAWKTYFDGAAWQSVQIDANADIGPATPATYAPKTFIYLDVTGMLQMLDMTGSTWTNSTLAWQTYLTGGLAPSAAVYQEIFGRRADGTLMVYYLK